MVDVKRPPPLEVVYTNHRGETALRRIEPMFVRFGATEWHPEEQWLLRAFDIDKQAERDFPLKDFGAPAPDPRAAELEARAEKAEGEAAKWEAIWSEAEAKNEALIEARKADLAKHGGTEIALGQWRHRAEAAEAELARLRAAGTFNEGIEAAIVAGWNACRKSIYAVCEDIGNEADRNRADTENPPRHHFGRGEGDAAKRIARAFNSMEARDDDNVTAAIRSLRPPDEGGA